ncbi:MAG: DUF2752 domain-containing protein [Lachnospiraceae bacterium]|nr:DUF2752 domain-containing protein [Lachnospiraceae bacterium]
MKEDVKRRAAAYIGINVILVIFAVLIIYSKYVYDIGVICPIHDITGINCPGCGGTRMIVAFLHGELYQALRYNAFLFISLIPMVILYLYESYLFVFHNRFSKWLDKFLICYLVLFLLFGVLRNIYPFTALGPAEVLGTYQAGR